MALSRFIAKGSPEAWVVILWKLPWQFKQFKNKTLQERPDCYTRFLFPTSPMPEVPRACQRQYWSQELEWRWGAQRHCGLEDSALVSYTNLTHLPRSPTGYDKSLHKRRYKALRWWREVTLTFLMQHLRTQEEENHTKRRSAVWGGISTST